MQGMKAVGLGLLAASIAQAEIRISEVFYDPAGSDGGGEWIELSNLGQEAVDLEGWVLDASGPNLVLPALVLPPGQVAVIHSNAAESIAPQGLSLWFGNGTNMGNTHGFVGLWRAEPQNLDNLVDYMEYGSGGHSWEGLAVEAGLWPEDGFAPDVDSGSSLVRLFGGEGPQDWIPESEPQAGNGETAVGELFQPGLRLENGQVLLEWRFQGEALSFEIHGAERGDLPTRLQQVPAREDGDYRFRDARPRPEGWSYWLHVRRPGGRLEELAGPFSLSEAAVMPTGTRIVGAWPNPFNPETRLGFDLARAGKAEVEVFDLAGRLVHRQGTATLEAGRHSLRLNLEDKAGGPYFARLSSGGQQSVVRILLIK